MSNKSLSIIANIVLPIVFLLVTAGLFFLFKPEEAGRLFHTNLCMTLWLEALFFGYLHVLKGKTQGFSTALIALLGIGAVYYIIGATVWMLSYAFLSLFLSFEVYVAVHVVLFLLWITGCILMAQQDNAYGSRMKVLSDGHKTIEYFGQKVNLLLNTYRGLLLSRQSVGLRNENALEILRNKVRGLPGSIIQVDAAGLQLSEIINQCETLLAKLEQAEDQGEQMALDKKLGECVSSAIRELEFLKNISRK